MKITYSQQKFLAWVADNKKLDSSVFVSSAHETITERQIVNKIIVEGEYSKDERPTLNNLRYRYLLEYKFHCFNDGDLVYVMDGVQNQWLFSIRKRDYKNTFKNTPKGIYIECYDRYDLNEKKLRGSSDILISKNPKILRKANSVQSKIMKQAIKRNTKLQ